MTDVDRMDVLVRDPVLDVADALEAVDPRMWGEAHTQWMRDQAKALRSAAQQHAGAVEALERIAAERVRFAGDDAPSPTWAAQRAQDALDRFRGQYAKDGEQENAA